MLVSIGNCLFAFQMSITLVRRIPWNYAQNVIRLIVRMLSFVAIAGWLFAVGARFVVEIIGRKRYSVLIAEQD